MAQEANSQMVEAEVVTLRPKQDGSVGLLMLMVFVTGLACVAYFIPARLPAYFPLFICIIFAGTMAPFVKVVLTYFTFVRLDPDGVVWRKGRMTNKWRWQDVTDYYTIIDGSDYDNATLATGYGTLTLTSDLWDVDMFKYYVSRFARNARTTNWREFGTRAEIDWPLTLGYKTAGNIAFIRAVTSLSWIYGLALLAYLTHVATHQYANDGPSVFPIDAAIDSIGLVAFSVPLGFCLLSRWDLKSRQVERITIGANGLQFDKGLSSVCATWQELTSLNPSGLATKLSRSGLVYVLTAPEGRIVFTQQINLGGVLARTIHYQTAANQEAQ